MQLKQNMKEIDLINTKFAVLMILVIVLPMVGFLFILEISNLKQKNQTLQQQAISLNFAEHNPTNGVWQWKTNSLTLPEN